MMIMTSQSANTGLLRHYQASTVVTTNCQNICITYHTVTFQLKTSCFYVQSSDSRLEVFANTV